MEESSNLTFHRLLDLPNEILLLILNCLDYRDLNRLELVNHRLYKLATQAWKCVTELNMNARTLYGHRTTRLTSIRSGLCLRALTSRLDPGMLRVLDLSHYCLAFDAQLAFCLSQSCLDVLAAAATPYSSLKVLNLAHCRINHNGSSPSVQNQSFVQLVRKCPNVTIVDLSNTRINDLNLVEFFDRCIKLKSINLSENTLEGICFEHVPSSIEEIRLNNCVIDRDKPVIEFLERSKSSLTSFHGNAISLNSDDFYAAVTTTPSQLRSLSLACDQLDDTICFHRLEHLTELDLSASLCDESVFATILNKCTKLKTLSLAYTYIGDSVFASLPIQAPLQELNLFGCEDITDLSLALIGQYLSKTLTSLDLSACRGLSQDGLLAVMSNCSLLRTVKLKLLDIVDTGFMLGLISQTPPTRQICIYCYNCANLNLNCQTVDSSRRIESELLDDEFSVLYTVDSMEILCERR